MEFLLGMAGAVLCLALYALGVFTGWRLSEKYNRRVTAEKLTQGRGSLMGCHLWGHTESDTTKAT